MCELMGMSFARPIVANFSIQAFGERSIDNADGWGLAWYPDRSLAMVKQPVRWSVQHTQFLEHYPGLLSAIYVAHVRQKTTGATPTHAETHPFARELNGREYCFAHNGTLTGEFWEHPLGRYRPIGGTDSEFLFCLLLAEIERFGQLAREVSAAHGAADAASLATPQAAMDDAYDGAAVYRLERGEGRLDSEHQWKLLHQLLLQMNNFGRLNCILTDGERMLVYHDKNGWKNLTYRNLFMHQDTVQNFGDATVAVNLQAEPVNHGTIVATNPLSADGWERFLPGEMKILYQGNIVYSSRPGLHESNGKAKAETVVVAPAAQEKPSVLTSATASAAS